MKRLLLAAAALALSTTADARPHGGWPLDEWRRIDVRYIHQHQSIVHRGHRYRAKAKPIRRINRYKRHYAPRLMRSEVAKATSRQRRGNVATMPHRTLGGYQVEVRSSVNLAHVIGPLAVKAAEIVAACGSKVISAYRPGARIRGSGRPSLHSQYPSRAVDLEGNPACIRRHLAGWPGGQSTDYGRVRHYHVSYDPGGREWGEKFAHWQPRKRARTRYAGRHRPRG